MDEDVMRRQMMELERKSAALGLRAALPEDKRRRVWREPLTKYELHILTFMREQGVMSAEDLAGAMDEEVPTMRRILQYLMDRDYVRVKSEKGYARYEARSKDELRNDT